MIRHIQLAGDIMSDDAKHHIVSVPVRELPQYDGLVAEDVLSAAGGLILPAGLRLSLLGPSMNKVINLLAASGVQRVSISLDARVDEDSLEAVLERLLLSHGALIDLKCSRQTVNDVENVFNTARHYPITREMLVPMVTSGKKLAGEITRCPAVVLSLARVRERDRYTFVHSFNVAVMSGFLMYLMHPENPSLAEAAILGGLLHDIGKSRIPPRVLNKNGFLDDNEMVIMRQHTLWGEEMALRAGISSPDILAIIRFHHERWNGTGYPYGMCRRTIPFVARVTAVADAFDTLTTHRMYRDIPKFREALTFILGDAGGQFDPHVSRVLLTHLGLYPPGSIVELSNGSVGIVVTSGGTDLIRPVVLLKETSTGNLVEDVTFLDLRTTRLYIREYLGAASRREI